MSTPIEFDLNRPSLHWKTLFKLYLNKYNANIQQSIQFL